MPPVMIRYPDFDGISMLADADALARRYRDHCLAEFEDPFETSVARDPEETLLGLADAHEALAWGTHEGAAECLAVVSLDPFTPEVLTANGMRSSLSAGWLQVEGPVFVTAWHAFTYGADYLRGVLESPTIDIPKGLYELMVHRPFSADVEPPAATPLTFLLELRPAKPDACRTLTAVPGADDFF